jgi:hypothetical protein
MTRRSLAQHCEVGACLAARVGLGESVRHALAHAYERGDGKRHPAGLAGEDVPVAVRIVSVARDAELWARQAGWPTAVEVLAHRRGHSYDPAVVDVVVDGGERWLAESTDDPCAMVLDAEPEPAVRIDDAGLDAALAAVADFTDIKSPWLRGHSTGVAELVVTAAAAAGLSDADGAMLGRAALVHDVGRVGVPNGIWDRPGALSAEQWERVRAHGGLHRAPRYRCVSSAVAGRSPIGPRTFSAPSPALYEHRDLLGTVGVSARQQHPDRTREMMHGCFEAACGARTRASPMPRTPRAPSTGFSSITDAESTDVELGEPTIRRSHTRRFGFPVASRTPRSSFLWTSARAPRWFA